MIEINNLTEKKINGVFLKKTGTRILKKEKRSDLSVSVAFVGQSRIKDINKKHRGKDKPTDVLSFYYGDLGEIVICPEIVEKSGSFKKELTKVFIHGLLHILGYDHEKNQKEARLMRQKQDYYLLNSKKYGKE
ncbi:MAG: rRNA maturation RNase YbeY [Candidatus Paceibacterota bacterium]|jgi:probable rRNA maturation factor